MNKHKLIALSAFAVFALVLLAVVPPPAPVSAPDDTAAAPVGVLLGVFEGRTPCADCPGIDTRLTLVKADEFTAEGMYELSLTYLESDTEPYVQKGLWTTERGTPSDPDATVYAIDPDMPDRTQRYLKLDENRVRQLDQEGNEIDATMPFTLTRVAQ